jgi:hypothetical protein
MFHHSYEHTQTCAKEAATTKPKNLPASPNSLDEPFQYQACGSRATFGQLVTCDNSFATAAHEGDHMRGPVRTMKKKDRDRSGAKDPTCFFGNCASKPEGGRLNRGDPDTARDDEQLAHV